MSRTPFPTWTPQTRTNGAGHFTREQWAIVDSETVNERQARVEELREAVAAAERDGRATVRMLHSALNRATHVAERALTYCTNSGMRRTECDTCDHTRQLRMMADQERAPLTPAQVEQLGDATGRIAVYAARALCEEWPHLDLERLVETFTRPVATEGTARLYLAALEQGATPGDAAGKAGRALIDAWAEARLAAAQAARTA
ncbi:hypothetical protein ACIBU0_42270 [Streptomyces sp. NPDC049627]|uniref:hypothetical protein n=1 Tax=Streptomyces sp. NPDC049627 TaxID=3365595 RepID=UPI0037894B9A